MKDSLKKKFEDNRGQFPFEETPLTGHENRFETKLLFKSSANKQKRKIPVWSYGAVAACILALVVWVVNSEIQDTRMAAQQISLSEYSYEMGEMETYFTNEIESRLSDVDVSDVEIQGYLGKLEDLKTEYVSLEQALARNYGNERVINAMIDNYKLRLLVLEKLKKYIEYKNHINTKTNETHDIS